MSDQTITIIINAGLLLVAAFAAVFSVVQARSAARSKVEADTARNAAITAQKASAAALEEANVISRETKEVVARSEARATERHSVRWEPVWETSLGQWRLYHRGVDDAFDVVVYARSTERGLHDPEKASVVSPGAHLVFEFEAYKGQGGWPGIDWEIEWVTKLGTPMSARGDNDRVLPPMPR